MPSLNFGDAWPWLQWVIAVAAVVAFLGAAIRVVPAVWRSVKRFIQTVDSLADLPEELVSQKQFREETTQTLASQDTKIAEIHHEVNFNNGSSVKDSITRVEASVIALRKDVDELVKKDSSES